MAGRNFFSVTGRTNLNRRTNPTLTENQSRRTNPTLTENQSYAIFFSVTVTRKEEMRSRCFCYFSYKYHVRRRVDSMKVDEILHECSSCVFYLHILRTLNSMMEMNINNNNDVALTEKVRIYYFLLL